MLHPGMQKNTIKLSFNFTDYSYVFNCRVMKINHVSLYKSPL